MFFLMKVQITRLHLSKGVILTVATIAVSDNDSIVTSARWPAPVFVFLRRH